MFLVTGEGCQVCVCLHLYLLVQEEVQGYRLTWGRNAPYSPQILQPQVPSPLTSGGADR